MVGFWSVGGGGQAVLNWARLSCCGFQFIFLDVCPVCLVRYIFFLESSVVGYWSVGGGGQAVLNWARLSCCGFQNKRRHISVQLSYCSRFVSFEK